MVFLDYGMQQQYRQRDLVKLIKQRDYFACVTQMWDRYFANTGDLINDLNSLKVSIKIKSVVFEVG